MPIDLENLPDQEAPKTAPAINLDDLPDQKPIDYKGELYKAWRTVENVGSVYPVLETTANLLTSLYGVPLSGIAGLLSLPFGLENADKVREAVSHVLVYEPQTERGAELTKTTFYPIEKLNDAGQVVGNEILKKTGSPTLATAAHTMIVGLPAIIALRKIPKAVYEHITASDRFRMMTNKERGLLVQSLEETMEKNPSISEAELIKKSDQYFEEAVKRREKTEPEVRGEVPVKAEATEPFEMELYRGIGEKRGKEFVSDPGDFGRGLYWTSQESTAKQYGEVISQTVKLKNPLRLSVKEAYELADDVYATVRGKNKIGEGAGKFEDRLLNAEKLTLDLYEKGYDGIIVDHGKGKLEVVDFKPFIEKLSDKEKEVIRTRADTGRKPEPIEGDWEVGGTRTFEFDPNSTKNEGRFRLAPPRSVDPNYFDEGAYTIKGKKTDFIRRHKKFGLEFPEGITAVVGKVKGKEEIQAMRFNKNLWPEEKAAEWMKENAEKLGRPDLVGGIKETPKIEKPSEYVEPIEIGAKQKPIPVTEINTYEKLSAEAERRALENIKAQDLKEEKKILAGARKKARGLIEEYHPLYQALADVVANGGFDRESVLAAGISSQEIADLNKKRPKLIQKEGAIKADLYVEDLGYDSVDQFLEEVRNAPLIKERVEELAAQLFDEEMIGIDEQRAYELRERLLNEEINVLNEMLGKKPKARKELKGVIRRESGQEKVKNIIDVNEAKALQDQLKFEAKAAREAFSAGKKEAALAHKERQRELTIRARERKQLRDRIKKAAEFISKDIPASVDFYYREAIDLLREGIDPSFRTKKTISKRDRLREFLERNPEERKNIPVKLLKQLDKKPLQEYTVDELEQIAEEMKGLIKLGKLKRKLKLGQKKRQIEAVKHDIIDHILKGEELKEEEQPVVKSTTKKSALGKIRRSFRATTLRPSRVADKLDGHKEFKGPAHKFFIDDVNDLTDEKLRAQDVRSDKIKNVISELGIKTKDFVKKVKIGDIEYSVDEMLDIYAGSKNLRKKLALTHGNNIPEETINTIIGSLTDKQKALADSILDDYEENYSRLREAVIENENRDMGYEENYSPMRRTEIDYTTMTQEVVDEILHRQHLKKAYVEKGMTIKREDIPKEFQRPIRLGLYSTWLEQMPKQEEYVHLTGHVKDMHNVLDDRDLSNALEQRGGAFGKEYTKVLRNYVDRVADPNIYKSFNGIDNLSRTLRRNTALYYLSANVLTMAKQLPSVMFYLPDSGPVAMSASFAEFVANPIKVINFVRENDPQVKHRQIERELEELKTIEGGTLAKIKKEIGEGGMMGIYLIDRVAISIGWNAVYRANVKKLGHEGAAKLARDVTLRTQPQAGAKDLPEVYASNEILNWFLQFSNQLNQIYNIGTHDIPNYARNKRGVKVLLTTIALALNALWIWSLSNKRPPEKAKDVKDAFSDQVINSVPIVGKTIAQQKHGWDGGEIPPLKGVRTVAKGVMEKHKKPSKRAKDIAEGVGILVGAPGIAIERTYEMLEKGKPSALLGKKPQRRRR